jgi:hypothetical protein
LSTVTFEHGTFEINEQQILEKQHEQLPSYTSLVVVAQMILEKRS